MEKIILNKGEGKTSNLIELASKNDWTIICKDSKAIRRIVDQCIHWNIDIRLPITYNEFINKDYYGRGIKGFLFDNVDDFIQYMSDTVEIKAITLTPQQQV